MQNMHQIQVIHKALDFERNKLIAELAQLNAQIKKKSDTIKKISFYQKEYSEGDNLHLTRQTPALHTNLYSFTKKIMEIIVKEEIELNKLQAQREGLSQKIMKVDLKIKIIVHFEDRVRKKRLDIQERAEQSMMDDLSSTRDVRNDS